MKNPPLSLIVILFGSIHPIHGQQSASVPGDRTLFPSHWIRGYVDLDVAPPTNEPDLGRCSASTGQFGGANAPCAAFARYLFGGYVELQPFGRSQLRRVFLFYTPRFSFGNNVPQISYTAAITPIAADQALGIGIQLPRNFEFRAEGHQVQWLGRYRKDLGPADLHGVGPYGGYATVGMRWNFGGWGRTREVQ